MNIKLLNTAAAALSSISELLDYPDESIAIQYKELFMISKALELPVKNIEKDIAFSELESEYIRLFSANYGGVGAPPYASFYEEKRVMGKAADDIMSFYYACGYKLEENVIKGPPDHIALEIAFLSRLVEEGQISLASIMIEKHLNWLGKFEKLVKKNANLKFYPSVVCPASEVIALIKEDLC